MADTEPKVHDDVMAGDEEGNDEVRHSLLSLILGKILHPGTITDNGFNRRRSQR